MPIIDRRSTLTPANARASDVASQLIEHIAPIEQAKYQAAFKVQGIPCILYNALHAGRVCGCRSKNNEVSRLSDDGKASTGAINRILTGNENFGISEYDPFSPDFAEDIHNSPTSRADKRNQWLGDLDDVGTMSNRRANHAEFEDSVGDNGQFSPDLDDMFSGFDFSSLGISDVSCPICFGTSHIGGYTPFGSWRQVLVPADFESDAYYELPDLALSPGTHTAKVVLPRGAFVNDVFRTMNGDKITVSKFYLDGADVTNRNLVQFCDGREHTLKIVTSDMLTHFEMQFGLSQEITYFDFPKMTKSADLSMLEQQEPFQIVVSPNVPNIQSLDIIAESQLGKILIVQSVNPWNTRNRQMLGWECQVRVAQPQELWRILPFRRKIMGQKSTNLSIPTKARATSGVSALKGFEF